MGGQARRAGRLWVAVDVLLTAAVATPLAWVFASVKWGPQVVILGLLAVHALLHRLLPLRWLSSALFAVSVVAASITATVGGLLLVDPPRTADGHPVMAIGPVFVGVPVGLLVGVGACLVLRAARRPAPDHRGVFVDAIGGALLVSFLVAALR